VVSEDWVVRYHNRLLQLERQSRHWAPARSRVLVRENEAGEVAIRYRDQRVGFREMKTSSYSAEREKGRCPFPRAPFPDPTAQSSSRFESSLEKRFFSKGARPLLRSRIKSKPGDISIVV
jgi:hypothetical protein